METSIRLIFAVYSYRQFDFNAISDCLQLKPTRTTILGEQGKWTTYKINRWELDFGEQENCFLDEVMVPFRDKILSRGERLAKVLKAEDLKCQLNIVGTTRNGTTPALHLTSEDLKAMAIISMSVDIDLYMM